MAATRKAPAIKMIWVLRNTQKILEYPSSLSQSHSNIQLDEMDNKTRGTAINTISLISRDDMLIYIRFWMSAYKIQINTIKLDYNRKSSLFLQFTDGWKEVFRKH